MNNEEIKEIIRKRKEKINFNKLLKVQGYYDKEDELLLDYITNLQEKIEYNDLVLKALHRYFTEHECYEIHEFLRQLETCIENDMVWLKRMAGVSNE